MAGRNGEYWQYDVQYPRSSVTKVPPETYKEETSSDENVEVVNVAVLNISVRI